MAYKKSRKERVNEATDKMEKQVNEYFTSSEQLKEYLSFMSQFYNYSPRNSALIHNQFRGASAVGSFKFWKEKGFSVQKGEKSIEILTPNKTTHKFKNEQNKWKNIKYANEYEKKQVEEGTLEERKPRLYFSIGHVFDVSQTNATAKDLPEIFPNRWLEGNVENYSVMMDSYKEIASNMNVTVGEPLDELGSAKGAFYYALNNNTRGHIGLNPRNGELQNVKTMAHELAHARLHHGEKAFQISDAEKEFQAEMVAYTVNDYFGIDTSEYSLKYLANWTQNTKFDDKMKLIEEVKETSVNFIEKIEQDLVKEQELNLEHGKNNEHNQQKVENAYEMYMNNTVKNYTLLEHSTSGDVNLTEYEGHEVDDKLLGFDNIETFNEKMAGDMTLIDNSAIEEPAVVIRMSEADKLEKNDVIAYSEANKITNDLTKEIQNDLGYRKTWYSVILPEENNKITVVPMGRFDIGDGEFSNIHEHVNKTGRNRISQEQWNKLNNAVTKNEQQYNQQNNKDSSGLYWYELKKRPMNIGTQPKNMKLFDENKGEYGIIAYNEPLTDKELEDFEIEPYNQLNETEQDKVIDKSNDYKEEKEELEME